VEKGRQALRLIQRNLAQVGLEERSEILPKDVNRAIGILKQRGECIDLILMDPPYEKGLIQNTLMKLNFNPIYHTDSILVIEHNRREPLPRVLDGWDLVRQRRIGDTLISILTPQREDRKTGGTVKP
jgi:16S rRNA (guanine966-N2)-methyltransferase